MQEITTGHNSNTRAKCWHVYSSGVHVAMIALHTDVPHRADHPWGDALRSLAITKCAGPQSSERQWAGLALYSLSHQLVRRLLIDPRLQHRSDRLRQGPTPEASQATGKQQVRAHQRWRSSTLSNARTCWPTTPAADGGSHHRARRRPSAVQPSLSAAQQLLLDRLSPRRPCGESNPPAHAQDRLSCQLRPADRLTLVLLISSRSPSHEI